MYTSVDSCLGHDTLAVVEVGGVAVECATVKDGACRGRGLWRLRLLWLLRRLGDRGGVGLGGGLRRLRLLWWRSAAAEVYGWCRQDAASCTISKEVGLLGNQLDLIFDDSGRLRRLLCGDGASDREHARDHRDDHFCSRAVPQWSRARRWTWRRRPLSMRTTASMRSGCTVIIILILKCINSIARLPI